VRLAALAFSLAFSLTFSLSLALRFLCSMTGVSPFQFFTEIAAL
jgi:hypothetical protein